MWWLNGQSLVQISNIQRMSRRVASQLRACHCHCIFLQRTLQFNANKSTHCTPNTSNRLQIQSKCNWRDGSDAHCTAFAPHKKHWQHIDVDSIQRWKVFHSRSISMEILIQFIHFIFLKSYYVQLINNLNVKPQYVIHMLNSKLWI